MTASSILIDLRQKGGVWTEPTTELPDHVVTPSGEGFDVITLPNTALCADFLAIGERWAGIAVSVHAEDVQQVFQVFRACLFGDSSKVKLISTNEAPALWTYRHYPNFAWVEIAWDRSSTLELIEVQTTGVLWYGRQDRGEGHSVIALGLENIAALMCEADRNLIPPQEFGFA